MSDIDEEKRMKKEAKEARRAEKEAKKAAKQAAAAAVTDGDNDDEKKTEEDGTEQTTTSAKRSAADMEELSIDLSEPAPLSKKQKRLIRQGKLKLEDLQKDETVARKKADKDGSNSDEEKDGDGENEESKAKKDKSEFGVWIGNLAFDTTKEEIIRFIVAKTATFEVKVEESDITRVNLPKTKDNKIKGFAYVDFVSQDHVKSAIALSEEYLNGRNLLIKDSHSFEGRPQKDPVASLSKNPPSRILFVGNLSFDTTKELLEEHFQSCGEIVKIRMATFEDTGKCKGFAFVDFKNEDGATNALKNKIYRKLISRPLRLEFGEDRSKRNPNRRPRDEIVAHSGAAAAASEDFDNNRARGRERVSAAAAATPPPAAYEQPEYRKPKRDNINNRPQQYSNPDMAANKRLKSSVALASAQRASAAIVESKGKKTVF